MKKVTKAKRMGKFRKEYKWNTYGRLTVIDEVPREEWKSRRREVLCLCECGKIIQCRTDNLSSGNTTSCGCYEKELKKERERIYVTGKKFGRLLVLAEEEFGGDNQKRKALCKCDCGNIVWRRIADLRNGMTRSCGCLKRELTRERCVEDLTGQTFNELTAIKPICNDKRLKWLWKCSCGREYVALPMNVKRGMTKSCGHLGKSQAESEMFKFLQDNSVNFSYNTSPFDDFRNPMTGYKLYVDFCFIKPNGEYIFVEHQGEQHYYDDKRNNNFGYEQRKFTDKIKREYCERNGIKLYETRYDEDYIAHLAQILKENGLLKEKVA